MRILAPLFAVVILFIGTTFLLERSNRAYKPLSFLKSRLQNRLEYIAHEVNNSNLGWKARVNFNPRHSPNSLKLLLQKLSTNIVVDIPLKDGSLRKDANLSIPDTFDSRSQWPHCPLIGSIQDQGACASGWAVSVAQMASDRTCIGTKGASSVELSALDIVECSDNISMTQCGKYGSAWKALTLQKTKKLCTGGQFGTKGSCKPYVFAPCAHTSAGSNIYPVCPQNLHYTPQCSIVCDSSSSQDYHTERFGADEIYGVEGNEESFKGELVNNGPFVTTMTIYEDFLTYESGVYAHTLGSKIIGEQIVRIVGFGNEGGRKYWLVANTWNTSFGEKGFFKVLRGENESGIETSGYAGNPSL